MKSRFTGTGTANYKNILIDIILGILVPSHHDTLCLCQEYILVEPWVCSKTSEEKARHEAPNVVYCC